MNFANNVERSGYGEELQFRMEECLDLSPEDSLEGRYQAPSEAINSVLDSLVGEYDMAGGRNIIHVGDGKNVYKLKVNDSDVSNHLPDEIDELRVDCIGVCKPETYQDIVRNKGFDGVLDYLDGEHSQAIGYSPENGFVYHDDNVEKSESGLPDSNAARKTKMGVLKEERIFRE